MLKGFIIKVYAFGSRYKCTNRKFSDFDLAIDLNRKMTREFEI
ncbi:nucleotidyltransferase domain-containing protein [Brachyspira alvinipulli]|nr:nucleotidyltransferase domain-containing protein [Brachyspira alvinipulli]